MERDSGVTTMAHGILGHGDKPTGVQRRGVIWGLSRNDGLGHGVVVNLCELLCNAHCDRRRETGRGSDYYWPTI